MARPEIGQRVRITGKRSQSPYEIGEVVTVGHDPTCPPDWDGFTWFQSDDYPQAGCKFGWVTWEPVEAEAAESTVASRVKLQRRELRRLNQQIRTLRAERDAARLGLEQATEFVMHQRKCIRMLEAELAKSR